MTGLVVPLQAHRESGPLIADEGPLTRRLARRREDGRRVALGGPLEHGGWGERRTLGSVCDRSARRLSREEGPHHLGHALDRGRRHASCERLGHLSSRRESSLGVAAERAHDDVVEGRRAGCVLARRGHQVVQDLDEDLRAARVSKPQSREQLPEDDARAVHVRAPVGSPVELLGGHVPELALDRAQLRRLVPPGGSGDAEVREACHPVEAHEDVLWGHVAMHDLERQPVLPPGLVRRVEPLEHVAGQGHGDVERDGTPGGCALERAEVHPIDPLHDERESRSVVLEELDDPDHVPVADALTQTRLVPDHPGGRRVLGHELVQPLDRHGARRTGLPHASQVDGRHAAHAELTHDLVAPAPLDTL